MNPDLAEVSWWKVAAVMAIVLYGALWLGVWVVGLAVKHPKWAKRLDAGWPWLFMGMGLFHAWPIGLDEILSLTMFGCGTFILAVTLLRRPEEDTPK